MRTHDSNARLAMDFIPSATLKPVVKGKGNRAVGIASWQSIGKALLQNPNSKLDQCIDRSVKQLPVTSDLVSAIETVNSDGYVVVTRERGEISGIVTSADLGTRWRASPALTCVSLLAKTLFANWWTRALKKACWTRRT